METDNKQIKPVITIGLDRIADELADQCSSEEIVRLIGWLDERLDAEFVKKVFIWANDIISKDSLEPRGDIEVVPTGRAYAASHEFQATFPDGSTTTLWSPPWGDADEHYSPAWELYGARCYAQGLWEGRNESH
jgi:hypothetical protein